MIREIQAKTLLGRVKQPDDWFGLHYNMNLYRGCQHQCIYCDSRSDCYQIENFDRDVLVKANAIELLRSELARKRIKGTIGTGSMNDPYMPLEAGQGLTRRALEVIAAFHFPVHIITKSDLVLRDLDLLQEIGRVYAAVTFTVTAADDGLSRILEPGAPPSSRRLEAMGKLSAAGILTGIALMPVLPFIEDTEENIACIVRLAHEHGAGYILPAFGMTLRDRQRAYFYGKLDRHFPGLRSRYDQAFGERYSARARNAGKLEMVFAGLCGQYGIARHMPVFAQRASQPGLF
jgi:DNA repair photolyase